MWCFCLDGNKLSENFQRQKLIPSSETVNGSQTNEKVVISILFELQGISLNKRLFFLSQNQVTQSALLVRMCSFD